MIAASNSAATSAPVPAFPASGGDPTLSPGSPRTWSSAEHAAAVTCLAWNERETTLTSGDASGLVIVWTAHAGGWKRAMANQRRAGPRGYGYDHIMMGQQPGILLPYASLPGGVAGGACWVQYDRPRFSLPC